MNSRHSAFTLLELLVVVAILGVLMGGIGLYRINETPINQMESGIRLLKGELQRARLLAISTGNITGLMIDAESNSSGYLSSILVAEKTNERWVAVGQAVDLPRRVRMVPEDHDLLVGDWSGKTSLLSDSGGLEYADLDGRGMKAYVHIDFLPTGFTAALRESDYLSDDIQVNDLCLSVYLSVVSLKGDGRFEFRNPEMAAGIVLSPRGDSRVVVNP